MHVHGAVLHFFSFGYFFSIIVEIGFKNFPEHKTRTHNSGIQKPTVYPPDQVISRDHSVISNNDFLDFPSSSELFTPSRPTACCLEFRTNSHSIPPFTNRSSSIYNQPSPRIPTIGGSPHQSVETTKRTLPNTRHEPTTPAFKSPRSIH